MALLRAKFLMGCITVHNTITIVLFFNSDTHKSAVLKRCIKCCYLLRYIVQSTVSVPMYKGQYRGTFQEEEHKEGLAPE